MQEKLAVVAAGEPHVQCLDVLQDRCRLLAGILEVQRPLHGGKIVILDRHAANHEARLGIGINDGPLGSGLIELLGCTLDLPGLEQFRRRPPAVGEGEERFAGLHHRRPERRWQLIEPDRAAVGQRDLRVGPVGLIAIDSVAAVADFQKKRARSRPGRRSPRSWASLPSARPTETHPCRRPKR